MGRGERACAAERNAVAFLGLLGTSPLPVVLGAIFSQPAMHLGFSEPSHGGAILAGEAEEQPTLWHS